MSSDVSSSESADAGIESAMAQELHERLKWPKGCILEPVVFVDVLSTYSAQTDITVSFEMSPPLSTKNSTDCVAICPISRMDLSDCLAKSSVFKKTDGSMRVTVTFHAEELPVRKNDKFFQFLYLRNDCIYGQSGPFELFRCDDELFSGTCEGGFLVVKSPLKQLEDNCNKLWNEGIKEVESVFTAVKREQDQFVLNREIMSSDDSSESSDEECVISKEIHIGLELPGSVKYDDVIFLDVPNTYTQPADITVSFKLTSEIHKNIDMDCIAIFQVGYKDLSECKVKTQVLLNPDGSIKNTVTFHADEIPMTDGEFFQFLYIRNFNSVCGASTPFRMVVFFDDLFSEACEDDFLVVRSHIRDENTELKEEVKKLESVLATEKQNNENLLASNRQLSARAASDLTLLQLEKETIENEKIALDQSAASLKNEMARLEKKLYSKEKMVITMKNSVQDLEKTIADKDRKLQDDLKVIVAYRQKLQVVSNGKDFGSVIENSQHAASCERDEILMAMTASKELVLKELDMERENHAKTIRAMEDNFNQQIMKIRQSKETVDESFQHAAASCKKDEILQAMTTSKQLVLNELNKERESHAKAIRTMEDGYCQQISEIRQQLQEAVERKCAISHEMEELNIEYGKIKGQLNLVIKEFDSLNVERNQMNIEYIELKTQFNAKDEEIRQINDDKTAMEKQLVQKDAEIQQSNMDISEMLKQLQAKDAEIQQSNVDKSEMLKQLEEKKKELKMAAKGNSNHEKQLKELSAEIKKMKMTGELHMNSEMLFNQALQMEKESRTKMEKDLKTRLLEAGEIYKEQYNEIKQLRKQGKRLSVAKPKNDKEMPELNILVTENITEKKVNEYVSDDELATRPKKNPTLGPINDSDTGEHVAKGSSLTAKYKKTDGDLYYDLCDSDPNRVYGPASYPFDSIPTTPPLKHVELEMGQRYASCHDPATLKEHRFGNVYGVYPTPKLAASTFADKKADEQWRQSVKETIHLLSGIPIPSFLSGKEPAAPSVSTTRGNELDKRLIRFFAAKGDPTRSSVAINPYSHTVKSRAPEPSPTYRSYEQRSIDIMKQAQAIKKRIGAMQFSNATPPSSVFPMSSECARPKPFYEEELLLAIHPPTHLNATASKKMPKGPHGRSGLFPTRSLRKSIHAQPHQFGLLQPTHAAASTETQKSPHGRGLFPTYPSFGGLNSSFWEAAPADPLQSTDLDAKAATSLTKSKFAELSNSIATFAATTKSLTSQEIPKAAHGSDNHPSGASEVTYFAKKCPICAEEFYTHGEDMSLMSDHVAFAHSQNVCPICGALFDLKLPNDYFKFHVENHFMDDWKVGSN